MVAAQAIAGRMSVEEYRAVERAGTQTKHEYYEGHLYLMAGGTRRHAALSGNTYSLLAAAVAGGPCRVYNSDMRVRVSDSVQVYPDASVTCDQRDQENDQDDEIAFPRLVVEVLSSSTERIDRGRKLRDYQACSTVEEYALVNSEYQAVELYRRSGREWTYRRYESDDVVEFVSIDARFPLAAFYSRTSVPTVPPDPFGVAGTARVPAAETEGL